MEDSPFDTNVKQIVFKLKALDFADFKMLPQPLEVMAKAAVRSKFPVYISPRENGDFIISSRIVEFSCAREEPDFICSYHKDADRVELLLSAQIDCFLPKEQQDNIFKQHIGMHTPFNVRWDGRSLFVCGVAFCEDGQLSLHVANQFFGMMTYYTCSLCNEIVDANNEFKAQMK